MCSHASFKMKYNLFLVCIRPLQPNPLCLRLQQQNYDFYSEAQEPLKVSASSKERKKWEMSES